MPHYLRVRLKLGILTIAVYLIGYFVLINFVAFIPFLSQTKSGPKNRRGRDLHLYEVTPRSSSKLYTSVEQNDDHTRLDLLPIKSATGIIRRKADRLENEGKC